MSERRIYNKFQAEEFEGPQHYGNRIFVEEYNEEFDFWFCVNGTEHFVYAKCKYEPQTRNKIGRLGAYRDIPDDEKVKEIVAKLEAEYL